MSTATIPTTDSPIRIGISSCLLGQRVRFDGNHKQDRYLTDILGPYVEFLPFCPEVAIGMGVPRPPIRLVGEPHAPRAVGIRDPQLDVTAPLRDYGRRIAAGLGGISGYIFKSKSPSCGMARVKVYGGPGQAAAKTGTGLYAGQIMVAHPLLPVEEEGRLGDPELRDNFLERVFAYRRWQDLTAAGVTAARLVDFHTRHKLSLLAHGTEAYRDLGRLVAEAGGRRARGLAGTYGAAFMAALQRRATRRRHTNVLQHLAGYLKKVLDSPDRQELQALIEAYRLGQVPRIVPITLLQHHFRRHPDAYVERQLYLYMPRAELMLRSYL